jgi:hypothetical protein
MAGRKQPKYIPMSDTARERFNEPREPLDAERLTYARLAQYVRMIEARAATAQPLLDDKEWCGLVDLGRGLVEAGRLLVEEARVMQAFADLRSGTYKAIELEKK